MNYYRRFLGDYASKTAFLSLAEHGAYNVLLDIYYSTEKPLPAALTALHRLCRAMSREEQAAVHSVADQFFPVGTDGLRHNSRADEEIAKAQATIKKQRASGAESASKRWSTDESTDGSTHKLTDESTDGLEGRSAIQPPTSNLQPPASNRQGKPSRASRSASVGLNGAFSDFWTAYPRKKSRGHAEKAWLKIKPDEQLSASIIAAVKRATTSADWQRDGGQYIPHPATWLNAKGWEDEIAGSSVPEADL